MTICALDGQSLAKALQILFDLAEEGRNGLAVTLESVEKVLDMFNPSAP
jgi:hypothetical protein